MSKLTRHNSMHLFFRVYGYFALIIASVKVSFLLFPEINEILLIALVMLVAAIGMYLLFWVINKTVPLVAIAIISTIIALLVGIG